MAIIDGIANKLGYERKDSLETKIKQAIEKQRLTGNSFGAGSFFQYGSIADYGLGSPIVSGLTNNKAILTEYWINPLYGQPRLVDLKTVRMLARHGIGRMAIEKILDIMAHEEWTIQPKKGKEKNQKHIDFVFEFLQNPNRNNETMDSIIRKLGRSVLESDDGVGVKVFDEYEEVETARGFGQVFPQQNLNTSYGYPVDLKPKDKAQLIELYAEDGTSFLIQSDMHGFITHYWQYSFILPRRPIRFWTREICYIKQNTHAGSLYGLSPFEAIVDWLQYIIKAGKYGERFFDNSSYPSFQLDLPLIKTQEDIEKWAEWYRKNYMGIEKSFQVLVTNGGAKVTPLTFDNVALQNLESQKWYVDLVLAMLKTPKMLLGIPEGTNRSVMGGQMAMFKTQAIKPLEKIIAAEINKHIISELDPDGCCEWVFLEKTDLDEETKRSSIYASYLQNGVYTPNEVRLDLDKEPIEDEAMDMTLFQRQQQIADQMAEQTRIQNEQAKTSKKPKPSESPTFSGNEPEKSAVSEPTYVVKTPTIVDEIKKQTPEYIGICTHDNEEVYSDTLTKHSQHTVLRNGRYVDLAKLFGKEIVSAQKEITKMKLDMLKEKAEAAREVKDYVGEIKKKRLKKE